MAKVLKVLIIDDEPNILEVGRLYLSRYGHQVSFASDGEEEITRLRRERPGLVVLDLISRSSEASRSIAGARVSAECPLLC